LDTWSFIPAAAQRCLSSMVAWAVMATMGSAAKRAWERRRAVAW
jgi:hypothetical protein